MPRPRRMLRGGFDRELDSPDIAEVERVLGIQTDLYLERRDELLSVIREQAAARAEALRAAGVDELQAKADDWKERANSLSAKIDALNPKTIEGRLRCWSAMFPIGPTMPLRGCVRWWLGRHGHERGSQPARDARSCRL
jgi:hypothetical protein